MSVFIEPRQAAKALLLSWACGLPFFMVSPEVAAAPSNVKKLDPVVVSASAIPTPSTQAPASVTVIMRNEIANQQANQLSAILQQIPGVFVDGMGGRGGISSVYIRGGDPNFTLIMIDGIPLNDPSNQRGGSVDLSTLTPERIERIEIVRGSASVLYGSDAMAGAINIITRKGQPTSQHHLRVEGGQFGYGRGVLQTQGANQHFTYAGSAAITRNDAQVQGDQFKAGTVGGSVRWSNDRTLNLQATSQYSKTDTHAFPEGSGGSRLAILRDTEQRKTDEFVLGFNLNHQINQAWTQQLAANIFYRQQDVDNPGVLSAPSTFQVPPTAFTTDFTRYRFLWTLRTTITEDWKVAGGLQLIQEHGKRAGTQQLTVLGSPSDQQNNFRKSRTTPAGFLETSWAPLSIATFTGGLRVDDPEGFSTEVTPRVSLILHVLPGTHIRGSYGKGFKLPSFNALSDPLTGNASLVPETSHGWDLSIHQELFQKRASVDLTYFFNRFKNLIDLDPALASQGIFTLVNLNTVTTSGIELGIAFTPISIVTLKGFMTYLNTNIEGTNDPLRNRPKISGGLIVHAQPISRLNIRSQLHIVGQRFDLQIPTSQTSVPSYYRIDVTATLALNDSWKILGVIENLTNVQYEEFLGFEAPGVWVRFGLEYALDGE